MSRITTMRVVVMHDVGVTNMLTEHRGRNLGSIRGVFMGDCRVTSSVRNG